MQRTFAIGALLGALAAPVSGAAAVVYLELDGFGTYTTDTFAACGMGAVTETGGGTLSFGPHGLGVDSPSGGLSAYLDGSEELSFFFPTEGSAGVTELRYHVQSAGNQNGAGPPGEAFLSARGTGNVDLGIRAVSGIGTIDVSALYGGAAITRVDITAAGDSQRINGIFYTVADEVAQSLVDFRGLGVFQVVNYGICDLVISGSHDVRVASVGIGIASAVPPSLLDSVIEGSEFARFDFATPFTSVLYQNESVIDENSNGILAESLV